MYLSVYVKYTDKILQHFRCKVTYNFTLFIQTYYTQEHHEKNYKSLFVW
jgi:hypothetical protein